MFQKKSLQYKNAEDRACISSCLLRNEPCTSHSPGAIYNSMNLINLINRLRRSKEGSNEGGWSIIKSNTPDKEFANQGRLFSAFHTIMGISKRQSSDRSHREPQQRHWPSGHGCYGNRLLSFMQIFGCLQDSLCKKKSAEGRLT